MNVLKMPGKNKDLCVNMVPIVPDKIIIQQLRHPLLEEKKINLSMARLDLIHPIISGNKIFKLRYYLEEAVEKKLSIVTYGGAYSNHLLATAFACAASGIPCIGRVRGEKPVKLSHTLIHCLQYGMQLEFFSREVYKTISGEDVTEKNILHIPEGGFGSLGTKGAAEIIPLISHSLPSHICTAVGTATTLAGLISHKNEYKFVAIPVLKNMHDLEQRLNKFIPGGYNSSLSVWQDYHFGGYAKHNTDLIRFMNEFYALHDIPLDFVYTGKLMFAVWDKIKNNYFNEKDDILCFHTGGLQGNKSLKEGLLVY